MLYDLLGMVILSTINGLGYLDWNEEDVRYHLTYWAWKMGEKDQMTHHNPFNELQYNMQYMGPEPILQKHRNLVISIAAQFMTNAMKDKALAETAPVMGAW